MGRKSNDQYRLERWAKDPHAYVFEACKTRDEHDWQNPTKQFPKLEYLEELLHIWHTGEDVENLIKSRQLMVSWLAVAFASWVARFHDGRTVLVQSKKKEDAAALLFDTDPAQARLSTIEMNLPPFASQMDKIRWKFGRVFYPNGSRIVAIPQGPKHYESHTASLVINDESSLQDEWSAGMAAARPMVHGGGKIINIATVRMPSDYSQEMITFASDETPRTFICKGMHRFRSASGAAATALHYSADPAKDPDTEAGKEWYAGSVKGYPGGPDGHLWRQHMELDFGATKSKRLIPFFEAMHPDHNDFMKNVVVDEIEPRLQIGWQYFAGFDYGKRNSTVFGVYAVDRHNVEHILWELARPGDELGGIPGIAARIKACPYWELVKWNIRADPSIWNDNQAKGTTYVSIARLLADEGINLKKAKMNGREKDDVVIERLMFFYWSDPRNPKLVIHRNCSEHIRQWKKLRYAEWSSAVERDHSLKEELVDQDNDTWDAFGYAETARPNPRDAVIRKNQPGTLEWVRRRAIEARKRAERGRHGIAPRRNFGG